jgi:hypothetical protein
MRITWCTDGFLCRRRACQKDAFYIRVRPGAVLKGKAHATVSCTSPLIRTWLMLLVNGLIDGYAQGENRIRELTTPIVELERTSMTNRFQQRPEIFGHRVSRLNSIEERWSVSCEREMAGLKCCPCFVLSRATCHVTCL